METAILDAPLSGKTGSTYDETFYFNDENGNAVDITAWAPSLVIRVSYRGPVVATAVCTITAPNQLRIVIPLTGVAIGCYKTDLRCVIGGEVQYPFEGDFIVEEAITRA